MGMEAGSYIYILFPECGSREFYMRNVDAHSLNLEDFTKDYERIREFFDYEKYHLLYSSSNVSSFIETLSDNEDGAKTLSLRRKMLNPIFQECAISCADDEDLLVKKIKVDAPIIHSIFTDVYQSGNESTYALMDLNAISISDNAMEIVNSVTHKSCSISILSMDEKTIYGWFVENRRPERVYSYNPKHGVLGKGNYKGHKGDKVSSLLCRLKEAEEMLKKAVGTGDMKDLYFYDVARRKYVVFKSENVNNQYHAYHSDLDDIHSDISKVEDKLKILGFK